MLLRSCPEGIICITQPCHAWVAGQLARAWGNETFGDFAPSEAVCLGAEQHDIGWLLWEQAPTLNPRTGYPHRFTEVPVSVHVEQWSKAKHLAMSLGRYVALLVSLHGTGLYERFRHWENSPESKRLVQEFLQHEYTFQDQLITTLQQDSSYAQYATASAIARNRQLVAIWDALSLALCHSIHDQQQFDGVPTANGTTKLNLIPVEQSSSPIKVSPWPFAQNEVTLGYEGRLLRQTFCDEVAMQQALHNAPWVTITNTLKPA